MIFKSNYNLSMFLLLPLISTKELKFEDVIGEYSGALINGFYADKNKPNLDNHIHLVFETSKFKSAEVNNIIELNQLEHISGYRMSGIFVQSYALRISNEYETSMNLILKGKTNLLSNEVKMKIAEFWDLNARTDIFKSLFDKNIELVDTRKEILPEEDYIDKDENVFVTNFTLREKSWYAV